jgi:hypothetical protein
MVGIPARALSQGALLVVIYALSACVQPPQLMVQSATGDVVPLEAWTASLESSATGSGSALHGSAMLVPGESIRETQAVVTLAGGTPRAVYPWYVQLGECGNDRGVLAGLMAYPPIVIDESGLARVSVTLPFTLPTSGRYFVSVRQSETAVSTVIACGNLTPVSDAPMPQRAGYATAPER